MGDGEFQSDQNEQDKEEIRRKLLGEEHEDESEEGSNIIELIMAFVELIMNLIFGSN